MPRFNPFDITGYREAADNEQRLRDEPFIGLNERICGVEVKPLTLLLFNRLDKIKSPFLTGRAASIGDVAVFLWIVSPAWREQKTIVDCLVKKRFFRSLRRVSHDPEIKSQIEKYISDALYDSPRGSDNCRTKSYTSWNATILHSFGKAYGWTQEDIENMPLKVVFQLRKLIIADAAGDISLSNPSDSIIRAHVERLNGFRN